MIFLPKAFERYMAALRLYIQKRCLNKGITKENFSLLKIILLSEAIYFKNEYIPLDIVKYSNSILGAAELSQVKYGKTFSLEIVGKDIYMTSIRLFTLLLCEIVFSLKNNGQISLKAKEDIIIKASGLTFSPRLKKIITELKGKYYYEAKKESIIISVPAKKAKTKSIEIQNEWCYILDKFSVANVWLLNCK